MINQSQFIRFSNNESGESLLINVDSIECFRVKSNGKDNSFTISIYTKNGREYLLNPDVRFEIASKIERSFFTEILKMNEVKDKASNFKQFYPDDDDESGLCRGNSFEIMGMDFPETFLQR